MLLLWLVWLTNSFMTRNMARDDTRHATNVINMFLWLWMAQIHKYDTNYMNIT